MSGIILSSAHVHEPHLKCCAYNDDEVIYISLINRTVVVKIGLSPYIRDMPYERLIPSIITFPKRRHITL